MAEIRTRRIRANKTLRFLDRYAGVPLVAVMGALRRRNMAVTEPFRRIGLMKTVAIGDTVLISGIIIDVRRQFPDAAIVLITGEDNAALAPLIKGHDEHVIVSPHHPIRSARAIRRKKLDALVDFGAWPRFDAMLAALSGAPFTAGFRSPGQGRHFAHDAVIDHSSDVHEIENFRRLVRTIGVESATPPTIGLPSLLSNAKMPPSPFIVLHPWPGGYMREVKEWPTDRWVDLASRLKRSAATFVLTGGPADREKSAQLASAMRTAGCSVTDLAGRLSLAELADLLAASRAVVSVNTGVLHLSAAIGARTVSLDGPTSSRRWGPIGPRTRSVESTFANCGYLNLGWEYDGHRLNCMMGVHVSDVAKAVDALIATS
jgi:heptosyltransferase III